MFVTSSNINSLFDDEDYTIILEDSNTDVSTYIITLKNEKYRLKIYHKIKNNNDIFFRYLEYLSNSNIGSNIVKTYDNAILETYYDNKVDNIKPEKIIEFINRISNYNNITTDINFDELKCISSITNFFKKIIDTEIKPELWFKILEKFCHITDHLMYDYKHKFNILCHNNLSPNFFYKSNEKIILLNFEHIGINSIFYELGNYFNNLETYPLLEDRKKYYILYFKKINDVIIEYIDKNVLLYSDISNLYWALWSYIQHHETSNNENKEYYNNYLIRINLFFS
jgi:thiamine kinase-like enzyme